MQLIVSICVIVVCGWSVPAVAANWPAWRGPNGDGVSVERELPTQWSSTKNVTWKTPFAG